MSRAPSTNRNSPAKSPKPTASWEYVEGDRNYPVVAICHPRWQGARSAAEGHSPNLLITPEIGQAEAEAIVDRLEQTAATHFIADGFFAGYERILAGIRRRMPQSRIHYVHHGSFYQMLEDPGLPALVALVYSLQREGIVDRIGFCKAGMAGAMRQLGLPAWEVMNRVPQKDFSLARPWNRPASVFIPVGPQLRKNPHTQVLGAILSGEADEVHIAGELDLSYLPRAAFDRTRIVVHRGLNRDAARGLMAQSNVVLYATISECAPMVPLESLAEGVPCVTGDNHGLFDGHPELAQRLVVSRADDPWAVAEAVRGIRADYSRCIRAIREFNNDYDRRAAESLAGFLGLEAAVGKEVCHLRRAAG